mgnify:CR=1 FL=1
MYYLLNVEYQYSNTVEAGKIISQTPAAGVTKKFLAEKQKIQIDLVVSKGTETTILEDYTVRDYREAEAALRNLAAVEKIVELEHLEATQEEIGQALAVIARQNNMTVEQLQAGIDADFSVAVVRSVLTNKVMKLIRDAAEIEEI